VGGHFFERRPWGEPGWLVADFRWRVQTRVMRVKSKKTAPTGGPAKRGPKGDYEVGYAKPPADHRFKPGNNANPKGRRKGTKNRSVVIRDVLLQEITVRVGGETKQMSKLEALFEKTLSEALAGDKKSAALIFSIAQKEGLLTPEQEEAAESFSETDAAVLEAYHQQFIGGRPGQDDEATIESRGFDDQQTGAGPTEEETDGD
jgi:hypothetical protein